MNRAVKKPFTELLSQITSPSRRLSMLMVSKEQRPWSMAQRRVVLLLPPHVSDGVTHFELRRKYGVCIEPWGCQFFRAQREVLVYTYIHNLAVLVEQEHLLCILKGLNRCDTSRIVVA